jgi:hypothetical protein
MALKFNDHGLKSQSDKYDEAVEAYAEDVDKHGTYPPTILIGVGGTGAKALHHVRRLTLERFGAVDALEGVSFLSIDTDVASARPSAEATRKDPFTAEIAFKEQERLNVRCDFKEYLGPNLVNHPHIRDWWDQNLSISDDFNLEQGAGQIRPLSRLVFMASKQKIIDKLDQAFTQVKSQGNTSPRIDQSQKTRVVIVAGLAGGTGGGMFLDMAALVRQVISDSTIEGYFVLPGVYKAAEGVFPKIAANGYACLRELNHYMRHPFDVRWGARERMHEIRGLYDRCVIFSGTNHANQQLQDTSDCYALLGEQLFIDFSEGGMARWVQGVRINRAQYLMRSVDREYRIQMPDGSIVTSHADSWKTCFQTFGISKLVFPSWRLLSYASYELCRQIVAMMDPGKQGGIKESLTELRDDFAYRAGFFQGERALEDGGRRATFLIVEALQTLRGARTGANSFEDHIDTLAQEMVDEAESMYANQSAREDLQRRHREVQGLLGDPFSTGAAGDWAKLIEENRKILVNEIQEKIGDVVEEFRLKPQVGPSGVAQLIDEVLEALGKPADRAAYTEWFRRKQEEKAAQKAAAYLRWNKQVDFAAEAHSGLFKSEGNHREAVKMAAEAFRDYWKASVQEWMCDQACEALKSIERILLEEKDRVRRVCEAMFELSSVFEGYRDFFSKPHRATAVQELEVPEHLEGQMLKPYLGWSDEEQHDRLTALMGRGLRDMGVNTLRDLEEMLRKKTDVFRARLFKMCFMALKGKNGKTNAFRLSEDEDHTKEGFINRYSAVKMLAEQAGSDKEFKERVDRLYQHGLPWVRPQALTGMGLSEADVPKDCFVGFYDEGEERTGKKVMNLLGGHAGEGYKPRRVKVNDPSEIIFYTESTAFPAAYVAELYDDNGLQRYYEDKLRDGTAVHIHQDYHQFQDLLPLKDGGVRQLKQAWKLFILGLMLGRIRADQPYPDDETRFVYSYRRQVSAFEQRWESLGPQMGAIHRLMDDGQLLQTLSRDVEEARGQLEASGQYAVLLALADYYFHCIFPVTRENAVAAFASAEVVGSAENEAVGEIRKELRERARSRGGRKESALDQEIVESLKSIREWACASARTTGRPSPASADLTPEQREFEWALMDEVRGRLAEVPGYVPTRNALGEVVMAFPRLRVDDRVIDAEVEEGEAAAAQDAPPPVDGGGYAYHYAGPSGRAQGLAASDVAAKVAEAPNETHKVWRGGLSSWVIAREEPAVAALLPEAPPPLDEDEGETYHYAVAKEKKGKQSAKSIAAEVAKDTSLEHKVWQTGWPEWRAAGEVEDIKRFLDDAPPPLDDEPPPLEDEPPPL